MIANCYQSCELIEKTNPGNLAGLSLKDMLRVEFLKFAVFLADTTNGIDEEELNCIKTSLGFQMSASAMKQFKKNEGITERFAKNIPTALKHFVLSDVKKSVPNDPFHHQKAQILTDTYKLFGQAILSCHQKEQADSASIASYTAFMKTLEDFLKEYGLFRTSKDKLFGTASPYSASQVDVDNAENVEKILEELNQLVGLSEVKEEVNRMVNLLRVSETTCRQRLKKWYFLQASCLFGQSRHR